MKKLFFLLFAVTIIGIMLTSCGGGSEITISDELDKAVGKALLDDNKNSYRKGECIGEGHIILGTQAKNNGVIVYALTSYGEYGFVNDVFTKISGSGTIPAVFNFDIKDGDYVCTKVTYPQDGAYYRKSIKKMFPAKYHSRVFENSDTDYKNLSLQEKGYAQKYLESIGRNAQILEYRDIDITTLTDKGISVVVSDKIHKALKYLVNYPYWIGTRKLFENGVRVVYELSYNENNEYIVFRKY